MLSGSVGSRLIGIRVRIRTMYANSTRALTDALAFVPKVMASAVAVVGRRENIETELAMTFERSLTLACPKCFAAGELVYEKASRFGARSETFIEKRRDEPICSGLRTPRIAIDIC